MKTYENDFKNNSMEKLLRSAIIDVKYTEKERDFFLGELLEIKSPAKKEEDADYSRFLTRIGAYQNTSNNNDNYLNVKHNQSGKISLFLIDKQNLKAIYQLLKEGKKIQAIKIMRESACGRDYLGNLRGKNEVVLSQNEAYPFMDFQTRYMDLKLAKDIIESWYV